jgi:hypothetical protein
LPVRLLDASYATPLLEFHDYLARRAAPLFTLGVDGPGREALVADHGAALNDYPTLAIMVGPSSLIRGICQHDAPIEGVAQASFTVDDSLDVYDAAPELLLRLADHARGAGAMELRLDAPENSRLLTAVEHSGFPFDRQPGSDGYRVNITEAR